MKQQSRDIILKLNVDRARVIGKSNVSARNYLPDSAQRGGYIARYIHASAVFGDLSTASCSAHRSLYKQRVKYFKNLFYSCCATIPSPITKTVFTTLRIRLGAASFNYRRLMARLTLLLKFTQHRLHSIYNNVTVQHRNSITCTVNTHNMPIENPEIPKHFLEFSDK